MYVVHSAVDGPVQINCDVFIHRRLFARHRVGSIQMKAKGERYRINRETDTDEETRTDGNDRDIQTVKETCIHVEGWGMFETGNGRGCDGD